MFTNSMFITALLGLTGGLVAAGPVSTIGTLFPEDGGIAQTVPNYVLAPKHSPTLPILSEDVVQGSVHMAEGRSSQYHLRWVYSEAGAQKFLAFIEANEGKKTCYRFGDFTTEPTEWTFRPTRTANTYAQFKVNWLKSRSRGYSCISERDAKAIATALKGQR